MWPYLIQSICNPSHPTPVLEIHGTSDLIVPYNSALDAIEYWRNYNNCDLNPITTSIPDINTEDIKSVTVLNNLGQKVADMDLGTINNNLMNINITGQAAGIYFIQVETSNGKASFKYNLVK